MQIIPDMMENLLAEYILKCFGMFYGLTSKTTRKLAYQYANTNKIRLPPTWQGRELGKTGSQLL